MSYWVSAGSCDGIEQAIGHLPNHWFLTINHHVMNQQAVAIGHALPGLLPTHF